MTAWPMCVVQQVVKFRSMCYSSGIEVRRFTVKCINVKCSNKLKENACFAKVNKQ